MKRFLFAACAAVMMAVQSEAQIFSMIPDNDLQQMEKIIGDRLAVQPKKARKVLIFCRCEGFCHNKAITYGVRAFELAARQTHAFNFDMTTDYKFMNAKTFAGYDAIVLLNCTNPNTRQNKNLEQDLINYVKGGKGLCVIHAGCDGFYEAPLVADMIGGRFWDHPWYFGGPWSFINEEPAHPVNRAFKDEGSPFLRVEEVYQHSSPPFERGKIRVLLSLNMQDEKTAKRFADHKGNKRTDNDFAVSWVRRYGEGRVFYTTFGHECNTFVDPGRLTHILDGLQYTLGDLEALDTPRQ
ncbi:MAG: ThuA domain-containing protein [Kiritimatiellae bacterium]|nr:ThuA domain-containing protein [Kiritimatiellia bacterium]